MIPLDLFDYSEYNWLDLSVTKYVNENLKIITRVLLDYLNGDPDFELDFFFPRDYLMRKPVECRNLIYELHEMLSSPTLRSFIMPKYEYLLYHILHWWDDCCDEDSELFPTELPMDLKEMIVTEPRYLLENGDNYILNEITDYNSYYYFCFFDHDFLPSSLNQMVIIYLNNQALFAKFFPGVELMDYIDLMDVDLRKQYIERLSDTTLPSELEPVNLEMGVVGIFYNIIRRFQKRVPEFEKRSEVEISNDICDSVAEILKSNYDLQIVRESTMGRAYKTLGETDLYIFGDEDYAVIENKYIDKFLDQFKQLLGYLNHYFHFGITISINKTYSLPDAMDYINKKLSSFKDKDFQLIDIEREPFGLQYMIKSVHTLPEDKNKRMPIYHLVFHLNDIERKRIAKEARHL